MSDDVGMDSETDQPAVTLIDDSSVVILSLAGEIDLLTDPQVSAGLGAALDRPDISRLIIDLTSVTFFGSVGIASLTAALSRTRELGVRLSVVGVAGTTPIRSLDMMGLTGLFQMYPTRSAALAASADQQD